MISRSMVRLFVVSWVALQLQTPLLAAGGESGWGWLDPVGRWVNLLILVGGLFYVLRIPASKFFDERRQGIRQQMQEAEMSRQEIEKKLADIENRLGNLDQELAEIRGQAEREAESDRVRILEEADREAEKVLQYARVEIDGMSRAVRKDLKNYAAQLAVELAEHKVRKRLDARRKLVLTNRFFEQLELQSKD